jgi:ATP-dependent RNA helicase DeaD
VLLSEDQVYVKEVEHVYCLTPRLHKEATLYRLLEFENPVSSMVFCNTREETRYVHAFLEARALPSAMLSSDLPQKKREKVLAAFREGRIRHLVTTDVASRGIDIEELSHVFIFSTPESPEQYIHRAGRTGRVGRSGRAISLLSAHDLVSFNRLVRRYKIEVKEIGVPSDEEVSARKANRIVEQIADDADGLSVEDFLAFGPAARCIANHDKRDRIVALLVKRALQPAPGTLADGLDVEDETVAAPPSGGGGRRRHSGRKRS